MSKLPVLRCFWSKAGAAASVIHAKIGFDVGMLSQITSLPEAPVPGSAAAGCCGGSGKIWRNDEKMEDGDCTASMVWVGPPCPCPHGFVIPNLMHEVEGPFVDRNRRSMTRPGLLFFINHRRCWMDDMFFPRDPLLPSQVRYD